jgi:8-oxo-dGTP pyrophosphatase MutT (NUDIX family)
MHVSSAGDGNGWVTCDLGHPHWGLYGAAGILVTDVAADGLRVLLQHRAAWTHEGGTWSVPGGARDSHESAVEAALREAGEETTLLPIHLRPYAEWVDDHGCWSYTTVLAHFVGGEFALEPGNPETAALEWWPVDEVVNLGLHSGFAASWPQLRSMIVSLEPQSN